MRTLNFEPGQDNEYNALCTSLHLKGYKTKDAKLAKRTIKKLLSIGTVVKKEGSAPVYKLEQMGILTMEVKMEEAEYDLLKTRFNEVEDWLPQVIEYVANALDILESAKSDA